MYTGFKSWMHSIGVLLSCSSYYVSERKDFIIGYMMVGVCSWRLTKLDFEEDMCPKWSRKVIFHHYNGTIIFIIIAIITTIIIISKNSVIIIIIIFTITNNYWLSLSQTKMFWCNNVPDFCLRVCFFRGVGSFIPFERQSPIELAWRLVPSLSVHYSHLGKVSCDTSQIIKLACFLVATPRK